MLSWSNRRKIAYLGSILFLLTAFFVFLLIFIFYKPATCSDGKQNQGEIGIDCGGPCSNLCLDNLKPTTVIWSRIFEIKDGVFSVLVRLENPNQFAMAVNVPYEIKLYDSQNLLVYSNRGNFNLPAGRVIGVLESNLKLGDRQPIKVDFNINPDFVWQRTDSIKLPIFVRETDIKKDNNGTRINVELVNRGAINYSNLVVLAIVYDRNDNAIGASQTLIQDFPATSIQKPFFVWPNDFSKEIDRVEYLYWLL